MAVILITGAEGQLGQELKVLSKSFFGYEFIFTDVDTLDLTDESKTADFIKRKRPDWIINCAAYNFVDKAEKEEEKAFLINSTGVHNISSAIRDSTIRLIHFSSDYVFDGNSAIPYTENSLPDPLSVYGRSKLAGEKNALIHPGTLIIRTSWLYSSFGNNFMKTIIRAAKEKGSLQVVNDQTGSPTYAADLAEVIMRIVSGVNRNQLAFNSGIYNYTNDGYCTWYEFASAIVEETGINCTVQPVLTKDWPADAKRPAYSVLNKHKIIENYGLVIPQWRDSLKKCIQFINKSL
jgi:dTDP-4-dehydrorhamnose reductase